MVERNTSPPMRIKKKKRPWNASRRLGPGITTMLIDRLESAIDRGELQLGSDGDRIIVEGIHVDGLLSILLPEKLAPGQHGQTQ